MRKDPAHPFFSYDELANPWTTFDRFCPGFWSSTSEGYAALSRWPTAASCQTDIGIYPAYAGWTNFVSGIIAILITGDTQWNGRSTCSIICKVRCASSH